MRRLPFSPEMQRYLIIGGSVYLLEVVVILVAQYLGASPVVAVAISFCVGCAVSFALQKVITFQDKRTHHKILIPQVVATVLLVLFNFGFTLIVTKAFVHILPAFVSRTGAIGVTTLWNFYLYKTRIFKNADIRADA